MPADVVDQWLKKGCFAKVNGRRLRPLEHSSLKDTPLSIRKGQAEVFCLRADDGGHWVLKKFHDSCSLEPTYLEKIRSLLPPQPGFASGTHREVLSFSSLCNGNGDYHSQDLAGWLDGTLLMPRVDGIDWSMLADEIRGGQRDLSGRQRRSLCRSLAELTRLLEMHKLAHRDLSSSNVFIHPGKWSAALIDFDSLYHPCLPMPSATTCGTQGYIPPYAWKNGGLDASTSWRLGADRFALTLLNVEFLVLHKGAPLSADGGMFDQSELRARSGKSIDLARRILASEHPAAAPIFEAAIKSRSFDACPSPEDWLAFCGASVWTPPRLADVEEFRPEEMAMLLSRLQPAAPLWPAPRLSELPSTKARTRSLPVSVPTLRGASRKRRFRSKPHILERKP